MLDFSPLFHTTNKTERSLLAGLDLTRDEKQTLSDAKTQVRACLRTRLATVLREQGYEGSIPAPRFFTQGSWAYRTLNGPARQPQQCDLDDGCYLPLSFVAQTNRPSTASAVFFAAAEAALAPLIEENGWVLDSSKSTCIRIEISERAHIDVPLYAIPDSEFQTLKSLSFNRYGYDTLEEAVAFAERDAWTALPVDKVLLAHRRENWKESDPRPIKDWFLAEVDAKGEQLRRVVRYLKAFRDWHWVAGGPSSVLLMVAAASAFEKRDRRDDLALLDVIEQLPRVLRSGVSNPTDEKESLTDRLGPEGVEEAAQALTNFESLLRGAIQSSSPTQGCNWIIRELGPRFPNDPSRVRVVSVAATIAATPAQAGPSELVGHSKAG